MKKGLYREKRDAEEMYEEAIAQRKLMKRVTYQHLISLGEKDPALGNYQRSNKVLEMDVNAGTMLTRGNWKAEKATRFDDK